MATLDHERTNKSILFYLGPDLQDGRRQLVLHLPAPAWQAHQKEVEERIRALGLTPKEDRFPEGALFGIVAILQGSPTELLAQAEELATTLFPLIRAQNSDLYTFSLGGEVAKPRRSWTEEEHQARSQDPALSSYEQARSQDPALSSSEQQGYEHGYRFGRWMKWLGF